MWLHDSLCGTRALGSFDDQSHRERVHCEPIEFRRAFRVVRSSWSGPFSVDSVLRQGLADSALPVVPRIVAVSEWIRVRITPLYLSVLRTWLALALLVSASPGYSFPSIGALVPVWISLPLDIGRRMPVATSCVGALLLSASVHVTSARW